MNDVVKGSAPVSTGVAVCLHFVHFVRINCSMATTVRTLRARESAGGQTMHQIHSFTSFRRKSSSISRHVDDQSGIHVPRVTFHVRVRDNESFEHQFQWKEVEPTLWRYSQALMSYRSKVRQCFKVIVL
jgi:hypothetical protein